jgi:hypothetical protein
MPSKHSSLQRAVSILCRDRQRAALSSPAAFRRSIILSPGDDRPLGAALLPWQVADFQAMDAGWAALAGRANALARPPIRRAYLERPRGHSKTTDTAVQIAWILFGAQRQIKGLAAAADLEQATLIHAAVKRLIQANDPVLNRLRCVEHAVRNRETGSELRIVSSDVRGSWGELPDFVVCDELCHWRSPDLWQSLLSSAAKRPESVLIVLSNAGFGRGWQWDVREAARVDPVWHFSSLNGPQAPWITEESLAEQQRLLPPAVFARLWLNQWQHSDGGFVSLAEAEACRDESWTMQEQGRPKTSYVASIDYAEKTDLTVGCVCHREGDAIVVDRMDVVRPAPGRPTQVRWVSDWMRDIAERFSSVRFILDEYQLLSVIQSLSDSFAIERFSFSGGEGNHRIALGLRQLILERRIRWYPGCGAAPGEENAQPVDSLEMELAALVVRQRSSGLIRFDHIADGRQHDDRAFALGVACDGLLRENDDAFCWDITPPVGQGRFGAIG